jgi:CCR4-NOT transcription complex subunit 2
MFGSPWADSAVRPEPEFTLPSCYLQAAPRLQPGSFSKFQVRQAQCERHSETHSKREHSASHAESTLPMLKQHLCGSWVCAQEETLFYIFYSMPHDEAQLYAAEELASRGWAYHKELKAWLCPVPGTEPSLKSATYERGSVFLFDTHQWEVSQRRSLSRTLRCVPVLSCERRR